MLPYLVFVLMSHPLVPLHLFPELRLQLPLLCLLRNHAVGTKCGKAVLVPRLQGNKTESYACTQKEGITRSMYSITSHIQHSNLTRFKAFLLCVKWDCIASIEKYCFT